MARVIEEAPVERKIRCPHCDCMIGFGLDDVRSTYTRGLQYSDGWIDADVLWHYVDCPNCNKTVAVNDIANSPLTDDDLRRLQNRYDRQFDI